MTSLFDKLVESRTPKSRPTRVPTDSIPQERFVPDAQRALAMMRGAVGAEAPSVMDPSRSAYDSAASSTELADMLSNLVPGAGALKGGLAALKAGAGALPVMSGIIRRGGDPTLLKRLDKSGVQDWFKEAVEIAKRRMVPVPDESDRLREIIRDMPHLAEIYSPQAMTHAAAYADPKSLIQMTPREFKTIAEPLSLEQAKPYIDHYADLIRTGQFKDPGQRLFQDRYVQDQLQTPFKGFDSVPQLWLEPKYLDDPVLASKAVGHEGRHRNRAISQLYGDDVPLITQMIDPQYDFAKRRMLSVYPEERGRSGRLYYEPVDLTRNKRFAEGGTVKTPRIPTRNTRFIDPEGESARGRSALEVLRGYAGAPSQASVMRPDEIGAYGQGESAAMAEAFIPGAAMAKMPLMGILSAIKRLRHGGTYIPGSRIRDVLYAAEDPAFASSYVEPNRMPGSQLVEFDAYLRKAAERELIEQRAKDLGIDNEYYTPASIFDRNLHDEYAVKKLIKSLTDDEYDHAILDDIPMGHAEGMKDTRATILFPNALTKMPKGEYAEGGEVKTPRIPTRNVRFMDTEGEMARGMAAFEALRGYMGVPSQASVMTPGALSAYEGGELAGMAGMLIPGAGLAKGALGAALAGVIKPKGGNWLTGSVENALARLKRGQIRSPESLEQARLHHGDNFVNGILAEQAKIDALDKWIEGPLTKYIKRDMATMDDPVRKLAEEGVLHTRNFNVIGPMTAQAHRKMSNVPYGQIGVSDLAKEWENTSDYAVGKFTLHDLIDDSKLNHDLPWVANADKNQEIYDVMNPEMGENLGFPHLTDELSNALNPESGLPRNLLLRPEQMQQMGMEKAVRHVDAINKWRAAQKVVADQELANKASVIREYADNNPKGLRWVELGKETPDLEKQLKYEGDTMGHCVGGYCPDVLEGRSRIFSLRDAKGEPHVTVEVSPPEYGSSSWIAEGEEAGEMLPDIVQIKGKQNLMPKDEYLPFVQDFVRNSPLGANWANVGDIQNTGLQDISKFPKRVEALGSPYVTEKELTDYLDRFGENGMADGGLVEFPNITPHAMLNRIVSAYNAL